MADKEPQDQKNIQQTEEFGSSLDEGQLLAQIALWEQEADTLKSALKPVWETNLNYYNGLQTGVQSIFGKSSKAVENRIWMAVETTIPIATSRLGDVLVISGDEDEVSQMEADALQSVLQYHMERLGIQEQSERFLRNMLVKRYGVFKTCWNKEKDDVDLYEIDPKRIRIPKYGKTEEALAFIIEDLELSYGQLVDQFEKEKADIAIANSPGNTTEGKVRQRTYSVQEVWTNEFVAWKCGSRILDSKENPYYDFKKIENNFWDEPRKPYVIKSLFHTEESIIGQTDYIQQLLSVQDNINIRKRQIEDVTGRTANPILLIDSDVMTEEQAGAITNEPGIIVFGKGAADGTKIRFENPGQLPNSVFVDIQNSRQEFDNLWGIHSSTRGERQGRETLGGMQLLKQGDLGRIDLVSRQLERAIDRIAENFTQLIKMFYTEDKSFSIVGENGIEFIKEFSGKKVGKNIRLQVTTGSTLPKDEVTQRQEAIQLWQMKAIGIRTLFRRLKVPNMPDAIQDFIDTQSGKILQGNAAPPVVPSAGTPSPGNTPIPALNTSLNQPITPAQ